MPSSDSELARISTELKHLSLRRHQLLERKKLQCVFQEMRNRPEFGQTASEQHEIDNIDEKLGELTEKRDKLQKSHDDLLNARDKKNKKDVSITSSPKRLPEVPVAAPPATNIFYVEAPPNISAPSVILDLEKLPPRPCRTQCPECRQFIMTETFTTVSSVTWMMCFMTAFVGCVAGCCLIPFCLDRYKTTTHRCPRCKTSIHTIKKL